ncbi:CKLF-like MARVEL transmembrane domain-containing protein 5 isoform X2 [Saimiri boliviensis]|uniref:CKLF-like MARVEL transmembrane domain-containing protein 5 isoform X2 n=1 Tax=Saimiri boliviensis TaxID=27679 RepID=UPI00027F8037
MCLQGAGAGSSRGSLGSWVRAHLGKAPSGRLLSQGPVGRPPASLAGFLKCLLASVCFSILPDICFSCWAQWQEGAVVGPTEMLSARDRRDRPPEEGVAAELQGFAVDKNFLTSLKGILLETELALTFIIFICFTASISAYMAAALLEFFITLAFLFLYATQYYQRFDRLNWPCLVFGIILVSIFAYDAFKIYRTDIAPGASQGDQQ